MANHATPAPDAQPPVLTDKQCAGLTEAFRKVAWLDYDGDNKDADGGGPEWAAFESDALDAIGPVVARMIADERERIALALELNACTEPCPDMEAGSDCPYMDAARIARGGAE